MIELEHPDYGYKVTVPDEAEELQEAILWVLNQSDGGHSLLDIAERAGVGFATIREAADRLAECGLLRESCICRHDAAGESG